MMDDTVNKVGNEKWYNKYTNFWTEVHQKLRPKWGVIGCYNFDKNGTFSCDIS